MKIYRKQNVFDAALDRIRFLFDEFPIIVVGVSGGKDSTIVYNLALKIAEEKNRLPLHVMFIDQEAEWQAVIDYMRFLMDNKNVISMWFQIPLKLFNATSPNSPWLHCWENGAKWIREREPNSIKVNKYNTDRFAQLFTNIASIEFANQKMCYISGVRCEESPTRFMALTHHVTYKHITWGKVLNKKKQHFTFYPLYDWSYTDIWKAIHDNKWRYCKVYDYMYQYGHGINNMRVSNVHHETAVHALFYLQEVEPDTWNKIIKRIPGINTAGKMGKDDFFIKNISLPFMFSGWVEYRDYLLENLISDNTIREKFKKKFDKMDKKYARMVDLSILYRQHINTIITNDYHFTKLINWEKTPEAASFRKFINKGIVMKGKKHERYNRYIPKV